MQLHKDWQYYKKIIKCYCWQADNVIQEKFKITSRPWERVPAISTSTQLPSRSDRGIADCEELWWSKRSDEARSLQAYAWSDSVAHWKQMYNPSARWTCSLGCLPGMPADEPSKQTRCRSSSICSSSALCQSVNAPSVTVCRLGQGLLYCVYRARRAPATAVCVADHSFLQAAKF